MPEPVAELIEAARVVAPAQPALFVEIGDVRHFRPQPAVYIGAAAARDLQLAEMAGECHLALVVEMLAAKDQHGVAVDRFGNGVDRGSLERPADIDAAYLADKQRMQLADAQLHSSLTLQLKVEPKSSVCCICKESAAKSSRSVADAISNA